MRNKSSLKIILAAVFAGALAQSAVAQWQWMDKDGRKVFSDRPPPAGIAEKDIMKKPAGVTRAAIAANSAASAPALKASSPKLLGKDAELEAKRKKTEDEEAAKKKTEDDKTTKAKAENCERGKTGLATLQSGVRIASVNAKGEREVYDDNKRAFETKRAQEIIDSSCK